ncbi:MAG: hypothetical protein IT537_03335 [Hyphomicrobiales bacterium]|nr:hypothetical protein [Hyphomicrobiales bacterium]
MTTLADILIEEGAPGRGAPAALCWMADWLPDAEQRVLGNADMERLAAYAGEATELHALLPSVLPLARPVWYESTLTAQHGTEMIMGYGAVPAPDGIDVGFACYAPAYQRIIGPLGPARVTRTNIYRASGLSEESWRELRAATGIIIRALLLGLGATR